MQLRIAVIAILLILILSPLAKGSSVHEVVQRNFTAGSSSSPWLKKVIDHPRSRSSGCWSRAWICREGYHPPPVRMRCCRNQCVDVSSDVNNCGLCGFRCPFTWHCCRGICVDTNISRFNCGRCGNRCPMWVRCVYGMCGYAQPPPPWAPRPPHPPKPPKPCPPHRPPQLPKGDQPPAMTPSL